MDLWTAVRLRPPPPLDHPTRVVFLLRYTYTALFAMIGYAGMAESVDAADLKSATQAGVRVQVPFSAPRRRPLD